MASSKNVMQPGVGNDPVTKAVVDNIMGNLPTKKPLVSCNDCNLSFTSQVVLDAHLQGARHAKQMKSKNIMANLGETKDSITKDETNGLKCNVCNVCLNSVQQLQTHLTALPGRAEKHVNFPTQTRQSDASELPDQAKTTVKEVLDVANTMLEKLGKIMETALEYEKAKIRGLEVKELEKC